MENFSIRPIIKEDLSQILGLIRELAVYEKEPDAVEIDENDLADGAFGDPADFSCLVAELKDQVVGMALFYHRFSTWKGKSIHLEDLIVTKKYRHQGIGKALFEAVLRQAHQQGLKRVEWVVLDWNRSAIDFYKKYNADIFDDWRTVQLSEENLKKFADANL
ncbi:MAG: GNAT family N-acetyltransferase [Psychroflexus sp.]|nr:GNAT family N-acetyltransferase [Psychroflexus sp.]